MGAHASPHWRRQKAAEAKKQFHQQQIGDYKQRLKFNGIKPNF